ncbi:MAG TPA: aspartyl protease family protein [Candidatus Cybelea sp.]|jgi:predicted aspartyl protease|nr:aspartyl protease family protein [Candidatus Cybelea sp.]
MPISFTLAGAAQPLILLPVFVNACGPFAFILDTGAALCLVTRSLASEVGIVASVTQQGHGAAGAVTLGIGSADSITLGDASARGVWVGITDELLRIAAAIGARVDGALGYEFLRDFHLSIDYKSQNVLLLQSATSIEAHDRVGRALPFRLAHPNKPLILLDAYVDEIGPFKFALDTGASTTVVSPSLASQLDVRLNDIADVTGGGGSIKASSARVRSVRVGSNTANGIDVAVTNAFETLSAAIGQQLDGILGYNFLSRFRVDIDYPKALLILTAHSRP